ncbi:MAG TPA: tRNA epoxyqueuosine(34) reductase QueG [Anaerolineales bacterium]|nr:tRNA epoxyqueuosine(34) reductase QueG [Anaerolineales bacterium]
MSQPAEVLAAAIKAEAQRMGFQLVGITTPDPPPHLGVYENWLAQGRQASLDYMASERARQRRADPRLILPECRSILVLGIRYFAPQSNPMPDVEKPELTGRLAAYAWGSDYHTVLVERMQALMAYIADQVGHPVVNRIYTDTGPILEREMAQRAGLGWIGKNTCLIHPRQGSYFLLAEVLLDLELPPDDPFETDHCGSCRRCLEACPTQCILPDRTLDAGRCISYLTIELKEQIPPDLRSLVGNWVFGCDICQQVCPWNQRFAGMEGDPAFAPRTDATEVQLLAELRLTAQEFNRKFKLSPVQRARRRGYLRNVAVALGNTRDERAGPRLGEVLANEGDALVRRHAAWALGNIGCEATREYLVSARSNESDPEVLAEIDAALNRL